VLTPLGRNAALAAWDDIVAVSGAPRPGIDLDAICERIALGTIQAWRVTGKARGFVLTSVAFVRGTDARALWIYMVGGKAGSRATIKGIVTVLEQQARNWGCTEIRAEVYRPKILRLLTPGWKTAGTVHGRLTLRKEL
jgi:hypothetical protein